MHLVVDHLRGARKGTRQIVKDLCRVGFGRHPSNDIAFDIHKDGDASARHAEVVFQGERYLFRDVGSSNGSWVDENRIYECILKPGTATVIEFGKGGPILRLWLGHDLTLAPKELPLPKWKGLRLGVRHKTKRNP